MSLIANSKQGDCSRCDAENTPCRKRGKFLLCISCCRTEDVEKQLAKQKDKAKLQRTLSSLKSIPENIEAVRVEKGKSELLAKADKLFGDFIKKRDADSAGNIQCPCCYKFFNLEDRDSSGNKVVQPLHFVSRKIYNHRFNEQQVWSGDSFCNLDMHLNPKGKAYQGYRRFMVNLLGEEEVAELEVAHRKINRIEESQLKVVIELYSDKSLLV